MKKIVISFLAILFAVVGIIVWNHNNNALKYEALIEEYMADLASKTKESTCFYKTKYFGKHYEHIYAWVSEQCYYQEDNKIVSESGSSMAYRFYHENDVIKSFENPEDGEAYQKSMEKLFPLITRSKMEKFDEDESSKMHDELDEMAKKHFNLSEITYESNIQNPSFGSITKLTVEESKNKFKKIGTINKREIYGVKNSIYVYDKDNKKHELMKALDENDINLKQVDRYLIAESENNNAKSEKLENGDVVIYRSDDYTVIVCQKNDDKIYFGDKSLEYKETYCK